MIQDWTNQNGGFLTFLEIIFLGGILGIFWKIFRAIENRPKIIIEATVRRYSNTEMTKDAYRLTISLINIGKNTRALEVVRFLNLPINKVNKNRLASLYIEDNYIKTEKIGDLKPYSSDIRKYMAHFYENNVIPKTIFYEILGEGYYKRSKVTLIIPSDNLFICNFCGKLTICDTEGQCEHCNSNLTTPH